MYQTWEKSTVNPTPMSAADYEHQLAEKDAQIQALNERIELLQGVSGLRCTIGKQATQIRKLRDKNNKLKERNKQQSRKISSLERMKIRTERKLAEQSEIIAQRDCEISKLKGQSRRSKRHRFGKKSVSNRPLSDRSRGAQPNHKGHGRTPSDHLDSQDDSYSFEQTPLCPQCGESYAFHSTIESTHKEVEVKAYKRIIRRDHYRCACQCESAPKSVTAQGPPQLISGGEYGLSVWIEYLFMRYSMLLTLGNVSRWFGALNLPISKGTLLRHNKHFLALFKPIDELIHRHQMLSSCVQMDETSWRVQEIVVGTRKWWVWVCVSESAVRYLIAPKRDTASGIKLIEGIREGAFLMCDRYSAYPPMAQELNLTIIICWFHARKDFTDVECGHPELKRWAQAWVKRIGEIYRLDDRRLEHYQRDLELSQQTPSFNKADARLRKAVNDFFDLAKKQLEGVDARSEKHVPLNRLVKYQTEMTQFLDHPWLPKDNNASERELRGQAIVRSLSFGSKTPEAAELGGVMLTVYETLKMHGVDVREWLHRYLTACSLAGGVPADVETYLPWHKTAQGP